MKIFLLVATHDNVGLTSVSLGLLYKLDSLGYKTGFFKPVSQTDAEIDQSSKLAIMLTKQVIYSRISCTYAKSKIANQQQDLLMEEIIASFENNKHNLDALVIEGLVPTRYLPYANQINSAIAKSLNSDVLIVSDTSNASYKSIANAIDITASVFGYNYRQNILGYIVNKVIIDDAQEINNLSQHITNATKTKLNCFAVIPYNHEFSSPLMVDLVDKLDAIVLNEGEIASRRVLSYTLIARTVENAVNAIKPGSLIITPGDRSDVILAVCMSAVSGVRLAGLLLTCGIMPQKSIMKLCKQALNTGLPIASINKTSYSTVSAIDQTPKNISLQDKSCLLNIVQSIASKLNSVNLITHFKGVARTITSPAAFRYRLIKQASKKTKVILLPEGHDPRIIESAVICHQRNIAKCLLLGDKKIIHKVAKDLGINIPEDLLIKNPAEIRPNYVSALIAIRKSKRELTESMALSHLEDDIVLGCTMLAQGKVDGLVAGSCNTTANVLRPAFQIIKPADKIVSSIFFMLMPTQVFIYGDCAVNPNPTSEQLALIARQSAESAKLFGIEPKIAMISYSTGSSGDGDDVELVKKATTIIKSENPKLTIDGPLQYDAASVTAVAQAKAPDSKVAGEANVFIFPDLNTGNTTYKAVQRSADVVSIGPMLQGLKKPVNDLSRGASIDDIVYTIALTAIQS